jgi:hypothetical protein
MAEVNCRCVSLHKIVVKWRMLARNSAVWDEECAVLFLETARAGKCPQHALFVMCTDKTMWRRAKMEHNWGRGWRSGRPVPTREHAMVVQAIRRVCISNLKERVRRWRKRVMWCKQRRWEGHKKLGEVFDKRRREKFWLKFVIWRRWSAVHKCHRLNMDLPKFSGPNIFVWDEWYHWFRSKQRIMTEEVQGMKYRFAYRIMFSAWLRYVDAKRRVAYEWEQTVAFCGRLALVRAVGAWRDYNREEKALGHRLSAIVKSWQVVTGQLKHRRTVEGAIEAKWHRRYVVRSFNHMKKLALYMMVIHAGGLHRIKTNYVRALWGLYAWITCDIEEIPVDPKSTVPKPPPERLPAGLKAMRVCEAHFHLVDCFRVWSACIRRRSNLRRFLKVS